MFDYFFFLDVVGLSKFTFAMLSVVGFFALLTGTQVYSRYFKEWEYRSLILLDVLVNVLIQPVIFCLILRLNVAWGVPDLVMIIFS